MKHIYLDTNILLSKWSPLDSSYSDSNKIIELIIDGKIKGYYSDFSLSEIASVVERQQAKFSQNSITKTALALEYVKRVILTQNLEIIDTSQQANILIAGKRTNMSAIYWKSIDIAVKTQLKTLDNIHIAIAVFILSILGKRAEYFITADQEIISKEKEIKENFGLSILSPKEFIETL